MVLLKNINKKCEHKHNNVIKCNLNEKKIILAKFWFFHVDVHLLLTKIVLHPKIILSLFAQSLLSCHHCLNNYLS